MWNRRSEWAWGALTAGLVAVGLVGLALAQNPQAKTKGKNRGPVVKKAPPNAADPLALPAAPKGAKKAATIGAAGAFHYTLKLTAFDGASLAASFYPARLAAAAPVVLLVHEKDRSGKDFEEPIAELKDMGFAEHLQANGYAVLLFDLRGHGANQRRTLKPTEWRQMVEDVQAAYIFLVDRNNRGELNLAKLGVVGVGEGANLVAAWAALGGGVSQEGRLSDVGAMVLISPLPDGEGYSLKDVTAQLAGRVPLMILAGERDAVSGDPVRSVKPLVERARLNKVELFKSSLHGYKLLRLEPKAPAVISRFLEGTVKLKNTEWEPRYNLTPVNVDNPQYVRNAKLPPIAPAKPKEAAPAPAPAKEKAKAGND